jgi:hypothetical protein
LESESKQKISGISYNIISYDPQNRGLIEITQKVVADFLELVGVRAPIQTLECKGNDELVSKWETLGIWRKDDDEAFCNRIENLYKAASRLTVSMKQRGILVTSIDIGKIVGLSCGLNVGRKVDLFYDGPIIISSYQISNHRETFETAVFHELGHMHGAPSLTRTNEGKYEVSGIPDAESIDAEIVSMEHGMKGEDAIFDCLGEHCLNIGCSMRQRLWIPNWRFHLTKERLVGRPYCYKCLADIKGVFKNSAKV